MNTLVNEWKNDWMSEGILKSMIKNEWMNNWLNKWFWSSEFATDNINMGLCGLNQWQQSIIYAGNLEEKEWNFKIKKKYKIEDKNLTTTWQRIVMNLF